MRRTALILLLCPLLLLALGGCAGGDDGAGKSTKASEAASKQADREDAAASDPGASQSTKRIAEARGELTVRMEQVGSKTGGGIPVPAGLRCTKSIPATCTGTITCPAGGDAPEGRADVCSWLADTGIGLLAAVPEEREACTMQYGGPELLTVTGEMNGTTIDASFNRSNGCDIARFDGVAPVYTGTVVIGPAPGDCNEGPTAGACAPGNVTAPPASDPDGSVSSPPLPQEIEDPPSAFE